MNTWEESEARPRTLWVFLSVAAGNLAVTASMNTWVLTDQVYRAILGGASARNDALIAMSRGWELVGYALGPLVLFVRVAGAALLVQLILLLLGRRLGVGRVFRAGLWAQLSVLAGSLAQLAYLASMPVGARTPARLSGMPGTALALLSDLGAQGPQLVLLLERLTIFDVGWVALFVLALEHGEDAPMIPCVVAVTITALLVLLSQWTGSLYLARLG